MASSLVHFSIQLICRWHLQCWPQTSNLFFCFLHHFYLINRSKEESLKSSFFLWNNQSACLFMNSEFMKTTDLMVHMSKWSKAALHSGFKHPTFKQNKSSSDTKTNTTEMFSNTLRNLYLPLNTHHAAVPFITNDHQKATNLFQVDSAIIKY